MGVMSLVIHLTLLLFHDKNTMFARRKRMDKTLTYTMAMGIALLFAICALTHFSGCNNTKKTDDQKTVHADYNAYHVVEARATPDGRQTIVKRCESLDQMSACEEIVIDAPMTLALKYEGTTARLSSGNQYDGSKVIHYRKIPDCLPSPMSDCTKP